MKNYRKFMKGVNNEKKLKKLRRMKTEQKSIVENFSRIKRIKIFFKKVWRKICSIFKNEI